MIRMLLPTTFRRGVAAAVAAGAAALTALAACSSDHKDLLGIRTPVNGLFRSYVAVGNSITAGYQSGGINDSTQRESYARYLADQMNTPYFYASIAGRGCPPPIVNFLTGERYGAGSTDQTCDLRSPIPTGYRLTNVAVPGAFVLDPTSTSTSASNILTSLILGGKTQVQRAIEANPSFVTVWIGNNDVLQAAGAGLLGAVSGVSPGITDTAAFRTRFKADVDQLRSGATHLQGGAFLGVVDVTNIPLLIPGYVLNDPAVQAAINAATDTTVTIAPNCNTSPPTLSLISLAIISAIKKRTHPPIIGCEKQTVPGTLVGDIFVLDAAERAQVSTFVAKYNTIIKAKADSLGFAYFDPNPSLLALRAQNKIPLLPNFAAPTQPFGPYISNDGAHPARAAHQLIADSLIAVINRTYGTTIPMLQVTFP
jgi:lysophospholipase L1-like esterase